MRKILFAILAVLLLCGSVFAWPPIFANGGITDATTLLGNNWAAPGVIGGTTPAQGNFTSLYLSGFTANDPTPIPQLGVTGTIDSSSTAGTGNVFGGSFDWNTVGNNTAGITGIRLRLESGYTGAGLVRGLNVFTGVAGSGLFSPFDQNHGNMGACLDAQGQGTGDNVGSYSIGDGSTGLNIGAFGRSSTNGGAPSIAHIGLAGYAQSDVADGGGQIGGFFSLHNSATAWRTQLTGISSAILADNGDTSYPVFVGRVNNTNAFTITNTGGLSNTPSADSTTMWQVNTHGGSPILTIDSTSVKSVNFGGRVLLNNDQRLAWYDTDGTTIRPSLYLTTTGVFINRGASGNGFTWYNSALTVLGMNLDVTTSGAARLGVKGGLAIGSTYYSTVPGSMPANGAIFEGNVGIGTITPSAKLTVAGDILKMSATANVGGGFMRTSAEGSATLSGASTVITLTPVSGGSHIPTPGRLQAVQCRVNTLITTGDTATSWSAAFSGGSTTAIATGQAFAKNTKVNTMLAGTEIVTTNTDITITPNSGTFSGGRHILHSILRQYCGFE